ncbi:MAG TPA: nuclear transport factor 2 family protein [Myxococcota bacterium]|nr:nuclear transport factor 2 family protein [Myxococcota bacterium]
MGRSVEAKLADELAIRALVARYCHAIAERDDKAWAETWSVDGEWKVLGQSLRGREAILAHYQKLIAGCRFVQQVASDGVIELEGHTAHGKWQIAETILPRSGSPALNLGRYADRYQRDADGVWRFARREFSGHYFGAPDLTAAPRPPAGWSQEP